MPSFIKDTATILLKPDLSAEGTPFCLEGGHNFQVSSKNFPISFQLFPAPDSRQTMSMRLSVASSSFGEGHDHPNFGFIKKNSGICETTCWDYCLVTTKFYDEDSLKFTKSLHVNYTRGMDCGCDPDDLEEFCALFNIDYEDVECTCNPFDPEENCEMCQVSYDEDDELVEVDDPDDEIFGGSRASFQHDGEYTVNCPSFCSLDQIQKLFKRSPDQVNLGSKSQHDGSKYVKMQVELCLSLPSFWLTRPVLEKNESLMVEGNSGSDGNFQNQIKMESMAAAAAATDKNAEDSTKFVFVKTGQFLTAPKNVLAAGSDMLKSLLQSGMIETQQNEIPIMDDLVSIEDFQDFLNGLHGHWTTEDLEKNHSNFPLLLTRLKLCDYYRCENLLTQVVGTIVGNSHLNMDFCLSTILSVFEAGNVYGIDCLKFRSFQWLKIEFDWKLPTEEETNELTKFVQILTDDEKDPFNKNFFLELTHLKMASCFQSNLVVPGNN